MAEEFGITHALKYTRAMIKLLQWYQYKSVNFIYNLVKVEL